MKEAEFTERVMRWAQRIKSEGDEDVARLLVMSELQKRVEKRPSRKRGVKVTFGNGRHGVIDADLLKRAVENEE